MLFIGMGTEVVVFFLSAFDRPFDRNEVGKELPEDIETDDQIAARLGLDGEDDFNDDEQTETNTDEMPTISVVPVIGSGSHHTSIHTPQSEAELQEAESQATAIAAAAAESAAAPSATPASPAGPVVVPVVIPAAPAGTTAVPGAVASTETAQNPAAATPTADPLASAAIAATALEGGQPF